MLVNISLFLKPMAFSLTMKQVMKLINDGVEDDRDWIVGW